MRAVISAVGKDKPGILAFVASVCAERNANIIDVTQKVMDDFFTMIMIVQYPDDSTFNAFAKELETLAQQHELKVHVMHEDIFNAMHTI